VTDEPSAAFGVDVGGTNIKWARLSGTQVRDCGQVATPDGGIVDIVETVAGLFRAHTGGADSIGLALPGLVDRVRGRSLFVPNVAGSWGDAPIAAALQQQVQVPVVLLNDARAFAYAELRAGAATGCDDVLFVTLGTGVGGAVAIDGHLRVTAPDSCGEIGHVVVDPNGRPCSCGAHGCLETFASAGAIVRAAAGLDSSRAGRFRSVQDVVAAADDGDAFGRAALRAAGQAIGSAAVVACLLLGTRLVVVGGGVAGAYAQLAPSIRDALRRRTALVGAVSVRLAVLGSSAGAIGAALYASEGGGPT
jgi:glucokinase